MNSKARFLSVAVSLVCLSACTLGRPSSVRQIGGGRYTASASGSSSGAYDTALREAWDFCKKRGQHFVVESSSGTGSDGIWRPGSQRIIFSCVRPNKRRPVAGKQRPKARMLKLESWPIGQVDLATEQGQGGRTTLRFSYQVAPRLEMILRVTAPTSDSIDKFVYIELRSTSYGRKRLARNEVLVLTPTPGAATEMAVTWHKEKRKSGALQETLSGTMLSTDFVALLTELTSIEVNGQDMEFALTSSAVAKLSEFAGFIRDRMPTPDVAAVE